MFFSIRTLGSAVFLSCAFAVLVVLLASQSQPAKSITGLEKFKDDVRMGLAEIDLPQSPDESEIDAGVRRFADFVYYRSGLKISDANLSLLGKQELVSQMSYTGVSRRKLSRHIASNALSRLPKLTDAEIDYIAENLRGFYFPGLPEGYRKGRSTITLRGDGRGRMDLENFRSEFRVVRDSGVNLIMRQVIAYEIDNEFSNKLRFLASVDPVLFGNAESRLTPLQALLVVYSIAAEDPLAYDRDGLEQRMRSLQEGLYRIAGTSWPDPKNYRAYGENGYLRGSPVKLLLDDATIAGILELFER